MRGLIQFDLPDNVGNVKSAKLSLRGSLYNNPLNIEVHPITNYWIEGNGGAGGSPEAVNWTHRAAGETWVTAGGDYVGTPYSHLSPSLMEIITGIHGK